MKIKLTLANTIPALFILMAAGALRAPKPVRGFDLNAFGRLPVLHNGRVKPIDSIARNSLLMLRGKQTVRQDGRTVKASEWFLDLSADPLKADKYKVFVINDPDVLGLIGIQQTKDKYYSFETLLPHGEKIRMQGVQASRVEAQQRSRFQAAVVNLDERMTMYQRLKYSVRMSDEEDFQADLSAYEIAIAQGMEAFHSHQKPGAKGFDTEALTRLGLFFRRYRFLSEVGYFKAVPPPPGAGADDWRNMGEALLESMREGRVLPAVRSYADILGAYKSGDKEAFNRSVAVYGGTVGAAYPRVSRLARYETVFNRVEPFYQGMILYVMVFLLIFVSWLYRPKEFRETAFRLLLVAFAVHTVGLAARMWLQGRPPVTNLYSSAVFVGWGAVFLGVILERIHRRGIASLVSGLVGFCTLIVAHHLSMSGDTMEMMQAVLDSNYWLGTHVVTITIGYSSTFVAGMLGHVFIFRRLVGKLDKPTSKALTQMTYGIICFCLLFSFVGTILGGIWADQSWGRFWGWDPKENGALLLVLWHSIVLHARLGGYARDRGIAVMAVFGNIICSLAWFGVNMLGIGLHTYGFMDKAVYWLMAFIASQLAVMALGFVPPSYFSNMRWAKGKRNTKNA
jgi:ABC-type transport system involved in cytochrome c biogenesis permease subunit